MPSVNSKTGNYSQPLGESYFTRNQAFYFALLAIKNAFSLDETRNLQKLRKRGNNAAWYFARMGNKARKILDVVQTLQEQFPKASGIKLGKGMLPYVMTGLLLFMPSQFQKAAHAGDIKEGPKLAMNTKAPTLPEGSRTSVQPAAHTSVPESEKPRTAFSVGVKRLGNMPMDVANLKAHIYARKGFSVVVYHGDNPALLDGILSGASDAKDQGLPVLGVMTTESPDSDGSIQIYEGLNGKATLVANHRNPNAETVRAQTREAIIEGHETALSVLTEDGPQASLK